MKFSTRLIVAVSLVAALTFAATALATVFSNPAPITIPSSGTASPYPSEIAVALPGTITKVTATLTGFSHTFPDDANVLLVGPTGATAELVDAVGDDPDAAGLNWTFDDAAAGTLPCDAAPALASGTFKPTDCDTSSDVFPAPAPAGPHASLLSAFNGTNPNGTWSLYVVDFSPGDSGSISGGWSLDITSSPTSVQATGFSARAAGNYVELRWRTGSEANLLGFNVYRAKLNGVRLNSSLIAARGGAGGATYRFVDRAARPGSTYGYRLEVVRRDGSRQAAGMTFIAR